MKMNSSSVGRLLPYRPTLSSKNSGSCIQNCPPSSSPNGLFQVPSFLHWFANVPERALIDTSAWTSPKREASELPDFLESRCPSPYACRSRPVIPDFDFSTPINTLSSPHTLVISPAALRVADLTRYASILRV